jgi:hypothetical protein
MRTKNFPRTYCIALAILLLPMSLTSQDLSGHKDKKGTLRVLVTGKENTKPVNGADVIVRAKDEGFEESTKTDSQGAASIASVPRGNVLIQIVASGWKTWGGQVGFKDDKPIQITLEKDGPILPPESPTPTP